MGRKIEFLKKHKTTFKTHNLRNHQQNYYRQATMRLY